MYHNFLKKKQKGDDHTEADNNQSRTDNEIINVDLIKADDQPSTATGKMLIGITNGTRTFSQVTVLNTDKIELTASTIWHQWCQPYGPPTTMLLNQGKV